jgi:hypothetical protein
MKMVCAVPQLWWLIKQVSCLGFMEVVNIRVLFQVLGLQNETEIMMLKKCFLTYAHCSVCTTPQEKKVTTILKDSHDFDRFMIIFTCM